VRIAITTVGSRGDLQPFIALGIGLKKAGYDVLIVSAKNEAEFVKSFGLDFFPLNVDIQQLMEGNEHVKDMTKGNNPLSFITSHLKGSKNLKKLMVKTQYEIWDACQDADLIINHPGIPIGFFISQVCNKKGVLLNPFPVVATKDYPSILFYTFPALGKTFNLFTHQIFYKVFWMLGKSAITTFWKEKRLSEVNFKTSPILQHIEKGNPVINAYSPLLFKPDATWKNNINTVGSLSIDENTDFEEPKALKEFIQKGEPPVFIGFGSMKDLNSFTDTFNILVEAINNTKQRAVIGLGWTKNTFDGVIPDNIFLIENVPFSWLFPQMKMVVHHGGAGTTAAGLIAGKPTVIIPHIADQPAWGKRVFELGIGSRAIRKSNLTAENLGNAITYALQPEIVAAAEQFGELMRMENGSKRAVELIDEYLKKQ
jgi:sterol 3beta-glucosyltransferase